MRDGVAPSYLWLPPGAWPDLGSFLQQRYPHIAAATWQERIARGELLDQDGRCLQLSSAYQVGMRIFYYREVAQETPIPFSEQILYRDAHILVVDKPHFLPVIPSGRFVQQSLLVRLKKSTGLHQLTPLHRLDRETAGVIAFSLNPATRGQYQVLFQERAVEKTYEALAPALPTNAPATPFLYQSRIVKGEPFFCMQQVAGEPNAQTWLEVLQRGAAHWLYRLRPITGRTHQLRVQMAALGVPILHDAFYPQALPCKGDDFSAPLQLLARSLAFTDPITGAQQQFCSQRQLALHWLDQNAVEAAK